MTEALASAKRLVAEFGLSPVHGDSFAYPHTSSIFEVAVVPIEAVRPLDRAAEVQYLVRERAIAVLENLLAGTSMAPVNVYAATVGAGNHLESYELYHGLHRYHMCRAMGYTHIPVAINPSRDESAP